MSNALAIAATTLTLRRLLGPAVPNANVTMLPPDQARGTITVDQLNLFLYETTLNGAWRNTAPPWQARSGETAHPPLALNLHYLLTAYGENEASAHRVLGRAMGLLHDHTLLGPAEIQDATRDDLADADLHQQPERIRITPLQLTIEEMSKLWSGFQTHYRLSMAYEASVVLIDSTRAAAAALPVLTQGPQDRGPDVVGELSAVLGGVRYPDDGIAAPLGGRITLVGRNLNRDRVLVRFTSLRFDRVFELVPEPGRTESAMTVRLPDGDPAIAEWVSGFHSVSVVSSLSPAPGAMTWTSNELAFALAPTITIVPASIGAGGTLTITCVPRVREGQRAMLLIGDRPVTPAGVSTPADPTQPTTLTFSVPDLAAGSYPVRLRVDAVDSIPTRRVGTPPRLEFDPGQRVTIT